MKKMIFILSFTPNKNNSSLSYQETEKIANYWNLTKIVKIRKEKEEQSCNTIKELIMTILIKLSLLN
jgi:hypothetical protein